MKHKIVYLVLLLTLPISIWAENASNVRVRQQNEDIIITYDLSKTSDVQAFVSINNGSFRPIRKMNGNVGSLVIAGKDLEIIWHPLEEYSNFIHDNVRFKVEAVGAYDKYALPLSRRGWGYMGGKTNMETFVLFDIAFSLTPKMSYGMMIGQTYSGIGWFVNARSNFNFQSSSDGLVSSEGGYIDDVLPFYSGEKQSSVLVANAGLVLDVIELAGESERNRFNTFGLYVGVGYGWRRTLWETIDGKWVEYGPNSGKGFSGDIGLIGSVYGLTLKAGINTINFRFLDIEAGIGWMF